ncbi:hypothetical protein C8R46DRAFT_268364 [Mycena filopes]|nr:hypothetical protein C8R46DRAFT_268364 [Mycena filopes]
MRVSTDVPRTAHELQCRCTRGRTAALFSPPVSTAAPVAPSRPPAHKNTAPVWSVNVCMGSRPCREEQRRACRTDGKQAVRGAQLRAGLRARRRHPVVSGRLELRRRLVVPTTPAQHTQPSRRPWTEPKAVRTRPHIRTTTQTGHGGGQTPQRGRMDPRTPPLTRRGRKRRRRRGRCARGGGTDTARGPIDPCAHRSLHAQRTQVRVRTSSPPNDKVEVDTEQEEGDRRWRADADAENRRQSPHPLPGEEGRRWTTPTRRASCSRAVEGDRTWDWDAEA